jgi:hypothetical protein
VKEESTTLEAMACNEVLALATDLNLRYLKVASDACVVIKNINEEGICHYSTIR